MGKAGKMRTEGPGRRVVVRSIALYPTRHTLFFTWKWRVLGRELVA